LRAKIYIFCPNATRRVYREFFRPDFRRSTRRSTRSKVAGTRRAVRSCYLKIHTIQALCRNFQTTDRSRRAFASSLEAQEAPRDLGIRPWIGYECQKHPWATIASLRLGTTTSGRPANPEASRISLCRRPTAAHISLRSVRSGFVPLLGTRTILSLRALMRGDVRLNRPSWSLRLEVPPDL
jgi:hypothetical protein